MYEYHVLLAWRNWMFTPNFAEVIQTEDNTIEMKVQEAVKIQVRSRPLKKTIGLSFQRYTKP